MAVITYPLWTGYLGRLPVNDSLKTQILTVAHLISTSIVHKCMRLETSSFVDMSIG